MTQHRPCANEFEYRGILWNAYTTQKLLHRSENFQFRPDDVVLATFPRSGTTLTQEIIWQIVNHQVVEKDSKFGDIDDRFPFLEFNMEFHGPGLPDPPDVLDAQTGKRLIKTHVPYFMLRDQLEKVNPKMIFVLRNPKDNLVSLFHFYRMVHNFEWDGTWEEFFQMYLNGKVFSGDFFANNLEWWSLRNKENVLLLRYEDLVRQPYQQIRTIATFLGYNLSAEKLGIITYNTCFDTMSKNEKVNIDLGKDGGKFLRKGACGGWKKTLTVSQNEVMDAHIAQKLQGSELNFFYE